MQSWAPCSYNRCVLNRRSSWYVVIGAFWQRWCYGTDWTAVCAGLQVKGLFDEMTSANLR
jgi:hypothetical protein